MDDWTDRTLDRRIEARERAEDGPCACQCHQEPCFCEGPEERAHRLYLERQERRRQAAAERELPWEALFGKS